MFNKMKNGEYHPNIVRFYDTGSFNVKVPKVSPKEEEKMHFKPIVAGVDLETTMHSTEIEQVAPKQKVQTRRVTRGAAVPTPVLNVPQNKDKKPI